MPLETNLRLWVADEGGEALLRVAGGAVEGGDTQRLAQLVTVRPHDPIVAYCYAEPVSYTHLRAHETVLDLVCRLLLEKKQTTNNKHQTVCKTK